MPTDVRLNVSKSYSILSRNDNVPICFYIHYEHVSIGEEHVLILVYATMTDSQFCVKGNYVL